MQTGKLFDAIEIRDTNPRSSTVVRSATHESTLFVAINGENQTASVQLQGRINPVTVKTLTLTAGAATVNETQTLTLTAGALNDTFTLTFNGHASSAVTIPAGGFANVTAAQIKAALITISDWTTNTADIAVTKNSNDYPIVFSGALGAQDITAITVTSPTGTAAGSVAETVKGVAASTFKLTFNGHESTSAVTMPAAGFTGVTAAQIKACLLTISDWTAQTANIAVVKSTNDYVISFSGTLATSDLGVITMTSKVGTANGAVTEVSPWFNIGTALSVTAATQLTQVITDPWPQLRATATYSVGPTSGSLTLWWVASGRAL